MDKSLLLKTLQENIQKKVTDFESLIEETRASNNDTKSSMGDKYETGREMLQQEINNLQIQLNEVLKQQEFLKTIPLKNSDKSEKGAVVKTEKGLFYISISLGEIVFENQKIMCISPDSPLAKAMNGKQKKEKFIINTISQKIDEIF